ncbi:MAG: DUF4922 domain-containing protein [Odoribacter sp.]|nr:DUF4922 domain-containing protein [Odoribacter sp.]
MGLLHDIEALRAGQISTIDKVRVNYAALKDVESKEFNINGMKVRAMFNPARAISSAAKVDAATISSRPCFLCRSNRLEGQESVECLDGRYEVLINPYPIFDHHFVIASKHHERQAFAGRLGDMCNLARELKGYTVFYNGPRCGASAPDHMHFQAILSQELPIWEAISKMEPVKGRAEKAGGVPADMWIIDTTAEEADRAMESLIPILPQGEREEWEPRVNLLATATDNGVRCAVVARPQHRPSFYTSDPTNENGMIISPASVDVAGVFVMPRRMDFDRLTADIILKVYNETCKWPC